MTSLPYGSVIRGIHHWAASAMVALVVLHLLVVFVMGAYKYPRETTWVVGVVLLLLVLGFGFTGYLLPWDEKAYWATVVGTSIVGSAPVVGDFMLRVVRGEPWPDIEGIAYRMDGSITVNEGTPTCCDLAQLPPPARDLVDMRRYPGYRSLGRRSTQVLSNRGCPFGCVYCSATFFWGKRTRSLPAERVVDEIESIVRDYGITAIYFYDDAFTTDRRKARAVCEMLMERKLGIVWGTSTRVDLVDTDLLTLMARAGCRQIDFGLETLNPNVCAKIGTKATYEQAVEAIEAARRAGIRIITLYLIIGLPGDDPASLRETFAKCLSTRATLFSTQVLRIYPGTELEQMARRRGLLPDDFGWYDFHDQGMANFATVPIYAEQPRDVLMRQYAFLSRYLRLSSALRQRLPGVGVRVMSRIEPALFRALTALRSEFRPLAAGGKHP
jgi:radical SAM superfamily enzyme YgiQ (UPF0313 family)